MHLIDFGSIAEFSRDRCIAICAFLIPATLLTTLGTLAIIITNRFQHYLRWTIAIATGLALLMVFHVGTWFAIGVVTPVTFILLSLATTCLLVNFGGPIFFKLLIAGYKLPGMEKG
jgi:hypothetical protein